jgi:hypothetical protein
LPNPRDLARQADNRRALLAGEAGGLAVNVEKRPNRKWRARIYDASGKQIARHWMAAQVVGLGKRRSAAGDLGLLGGAA